MNSESASTSGRVYRCGAAARWLPRCLAAAILGGALLASYRFGPKTVQAGWTYAGPLVVIAGAAAGLWILRKGAELRIGLILSEGGLEFVDGGRRTLLRWQEIDSLSYAPPFSSGRYWLPATVLGDRDGRGWRISALMADGESLIGELLRRAGRSDLDAWADALQLERRMARPGLSIVGGYAAASVVLVAALWFYVS
jgi:hypothetical protein